MPVDVFPIALGFDTCYVLRDRGVVVLDAGQPGKVDVFRKGLDRAGVAPEDVRLILLTHAHWDHMGSAAPMRALTGAPLAVHERERGWVEQGNPPLPPGATPWGRIFIALHRLALPLIHVPPAEVDLTLTDAPFSLEPYGVAATAVHTPGHSPGSVSILLDTGEAFVGDLAMNRFPLTLSPGLPPLAEDLGLVAQSWKRLLDRGVETIYPAHGKPFSADVIRHALGA